MSLATRFRHAAAWLCVFCGAAGVAAQGGINAQAAAAYFRDAQAVSERDGGKLWGKPLYGPLFFVDPETRAVVANQADREGQLHAEGEVFRGKLPENINPANTAVDWAGVHWTMVMWPVPEYRQARNRLLLHECFHRIQEAAGLPARDAVNHHLDTRDGRIWLQLEWRALETALRQGGPERRRAIADALLFRAYRRSLFPEAAERENALELNEGLAEYTGVNLSAATPQEFAVLADFGLRRGWQSDSFARSFAYASGPALGALLDMSRKPWRGTIVKTGDLGKALAAAYGIQPRAAAEQQARTRARRYDGDEIMVLETERDRQRQERIAESRQRFVAGPVLVLPASKDINYSYNPNNVMALDAQNTVYPTMRVVDAWGVLEVTRGALVVRGADGRIARVQVPAPKTSGALEGDGWKIQLKPGWQVVAGGRDGDFTVKNER